VKTQILVIFVLCCCQSSVQAHHVLGRPAYSLSEDSNTPPSLAVETQIGDFFVTYMVFPAFTKANEPGRLNLYIQGIDTDTRFNDDVSFTVVDEGFFSDRVEPIGIQSIDDGVYRQGFIFAEEGKYTVRAHFDHNGEPYDIDFPLRIGEPSPLQPLILSAVVLLVTLFGAYLLIGKKAQLAKFRMQNRDSAS